VKTSATLAPEYDVVVLGAGAGGMTAALVAATEGLDVLLIERTSQVGGSTSRSAGTLWIPGNFTMDKARARADIDAARVYLNHAVGDRSPAELRERFLQAGPAMLDYLQARSMVRFQACPKHMDYYPDRPGASLGGRAVEAQVYDGRGLGPDFDLVRGPIAEFMLCGGMMVSKADIDALLGFGRSFAHAKHVAKIVLRYAVDRLMGHRRGTRLTMGNALAGRLLRSIADAGVSVCRACEVTRIENGPGRSHVLSLSIDDRSRVVRSKQAVIFSGGGYSGNVRWREAFMPSPTPRHTVAHEGNDARTIELAQRLGAVLGRPQGDNAWWFPSSVVHREDGSVAVFPHIIMDRAKPGIIAVDQRGRRFVNEGINYHEFSLAQYRHAAVPCWLICDRLFVRRYGIGAVHPGTRSLWPWVQSGYLKRSHTIAQLARDIGVDAGGLAESVARIGHFARTGVDDDFGRGADLLSRQNGDASHTPNPSLGPIAAPPFFAVQVTPADLGTSMGLSTNSSAQLVDATGQPIPGLYACGNDMNSIMGAQYPAPGSTLGPAMTFAYIAAMHIAGEADRLREMHNA